MAATYHTTHLGLSLWAQTDCPQWVDFCRTIKSWTSRWAAISKTTPCT